MKISALAALVAAGVTISACCNTPVGEGSSGGTSTGAGGTTGRGGGTNGGSSSAGASSGGSSNGSTPGGSSSGGTTGGVGTTSGGSSGGASSGGAPCETDSACGADQYCLLPLTYCAGYLETDSPGVGSCHRNCSASACTCQTDADCPAGSCQQGTCLGFGVDCALPPPCAEGCTLTNLIENACPLCLCQSCPIPLDAGSAPDLCNPACNPGELCCTSYGGTLPPDGGYDTGSVGCSQSGADGGCPFGAVCDYDDGGDIVACNFYNP